MTSAIRSSLAAGLLCLGLADAGTAAAQAPSYIFQGPDGPTVLQVDAADRPIVPPSRPDLAVPAIPVPQVMNGSSFGLTGFNYYDEASMETRSAGRTPRRYVLAPAWITGPGAR
ncbi:hypothetical protein [uncultured Methylobacterium sp.]|uniref:hypothetical protein n=1 Tax=uncultured Methylobacterium sp. TaxID=157278 RepID=UPI0035CCA622